MSIANELVDQPLLLVRGQIGVAGSNRHDTLEKAKALLRDFYLHPNLDDIRIPKFHVAHVSGRVG